MRLNREKLRKMIIKELSKSIEEEALMSKDGYAGYGMLSRHDDPGRQMMYKSCSECGSKMYEGDSSCSECGYSAMEEKTRKEYKSLNEGDCGCHGKSKSSVLDHDMDDDFIPDHMTSQGGHDFEEMQSAMFDRFPHMKRIDVEFDYDNDTKIGNHKHYKGSYMAKSHMYKVAKYAQKLYYMIPDGHNLEDWMRTKLAQIADDIGEVYHALDHDIFEGDV